MPTLREERAGRLDVFHTVTAPAAVPPSIPGCVTRKVHMFNAGLSENTPTMPVWISIDKARGDSAGLN